MRILLALDGSPSSIQARDLVGSLSLPSGSSLTLLMAYGVPAAWFGDSLASGGSELAEAEEAVRHEADAALVQLAAPFSRPRLVGRSTRRRWPGTGCDRRDSR